MLKLFIHIADAVLRDAVAEQLAAAALDAQIVDGARGLPADVAADSVVVIDQAVYDKKNVALDATILLLGGGDENDGVTETFALPLRLGHLIARLRYYLETAPLLRDRDAAFAGVRLEPRNRRVVTDKTGDVIRLTEKETALLLFLAHSLAPVMRRDILAGVWGYDERIDTHTLETHLYQLRRKLDPVSEGWLVFEGGAYRLAQA